MKKEIKLPIYGTAESPKMIVRLTILVDNSISVKHILNYLTDNEVYVFDYEQASQKELVITCSSLKALTDLIVILKE